MTENPRFCADVHLGKLARLLRMLGFDVLYRNDYTKEKLHKIARGEDRILLSKDPFFAKFNNIQFLPIQSSVSEEQLVEVLERYRLKPLFNPFSRCLYCNELIKKVEKEEVEADLPQATKRFFSEFWQCASCERLYWKGSHYDRMVKLVNKFGREL